MDTGPKEVASVPKDKSSSLLNNRYLNLFVVFLVIFLLYEAQTFDILALSVPAELIVVVGISKQAYQLGIPLIDSSLMTSVNLKSIPLANAFDGVRKGVVGLPNFDSSYVQALLDHPRVDKVVVLSRSVLEEAFDVSASKGKLVDESELDASCEWRVRNLQSSKCSVYDYAVLRIALHYVELGSLSDQVFLHTFGETPLNNLNLFLVKDLFGAKPRDKHVNTPMVASNTVPYVPSTQYLDSQYAHLSLLRQLREMTSD